MKSITDIFSVKDCGVVVTGGASGLGLGYAEALAANGARVTLLDLVPERLDAEVARLQGAGFDVRGSVVDVTDHAALDAQIAAAASAYGRLDVVFANAGIDSGPGYLGAWVDETRPRLEAGALENYDDARWNRVIEVNLNAVFATLRAAARHMSFGDRLRSRFWRGRVEDEVDAELAFHVEMRAREYEARGMTAADAREAAIRRFGDMHRVNARLSQVLAADGVRFEKVYFSPESPEQPSQTRKPSPQLLFDARDEFGIDLTQSYMIGDKIIDVECGRNAGVKKSILVRTGYGAEAEKKAAGGLKDALIANDLQDATNQILSS